MTAQQQLDLKGQECTYLLHLELNGGLHFIDLGHHGLRVGEETREFTSLVQTRTQQTGNLLDQSLRGKESIVGLSWKEDKRRSAQLDKDQV